MRYFTCGPALGGLSMQTLGSLSPVTAVSSTADRNSSLPILYWITSAFGAPLSKSIGKTGQTEKCKLADIDSDTPVFVDALGDQGRRETQGTHTFNACFITYADLFKAASSRLAAVPMNSARRAASAFPCQHGGRDGFAGSLLRFWRRQDRSVGSVCGFCAGFLPGELPASHNPARPAQADVRSGEPEGRERITGGDRSFTGYRRGRFPVCVVCSVVCEERCNTNSGMLIKEYRIPLPLSVEEYRIAQLYMIQKKSREESQGEGNGVEILVNEPYRDGPGGSGQYTRKVYHIGTHIPGWFRSILPKAYKIDIDNASCIQAALRVEEEAWNAYPYTRTRYTCPFIEKFYLEIETKYCADGGKQDNVFNLSGAEKRNRIVDVIDVVKDDLPAHDYKLEEDPALYKSAKTGRGPLGPDWKQKCQDSPNQDIMCSYKLCKVEFRYWGMQNKIEKFIHDVALRKTMLQAHRQAWCWQDEWEGLEINDIRRLEKETQLALAHKMQRQGSSSSLQEAHVPPKPAAPAASLPATEETPAGQQAAEDKTEQAADTNRSTNGCETRNFYEWRFQSIVRDSESCSSSDEEFFDAQGETDVSNRTPVLMDMASTNALDETLLTKWSSEEMVAMDTVAMDTVAMDTVAMTPETPGKQQEKDDFNETREEPREHAGIPSSRLERHGAQRLPTILQSTSRGAASGPCSLLILVLHGGSILDQGPSILGSKQSDISTFTSTCESVIQAHFPSMSGQVCIQLVTCPRACVEALSLLTR
ncbi:Membrane-associated phosphatidylinositol transfer protein 2 [Branchiostoma belcheri]|nr:Membrane-associated phosphatidylinositol transfer protein 2 [Branchiostoma belcheri]